MLKSVIVLTMVCLAAQISEAANPDVVFEARSFKDADGKTLPYRLLRPENFDPNKAYPLVLFFHGANERGSDNVRQLKNAVTVFTREEYRKKFPCFVVVPQCDTNSMWVDTPWTLDAHTQPEKPTEPMRLSMALLEALKHEFKIEVQRIYVAGVSMGGLAV